MTEQNGVERSTATETLRAMLDERGVEWKAWDGTHPITVWHDETYLYEFVEYRIVNGAKQVSNCPSDNDGHCELTIKVFNCTPEQAIAATLGRGTCRFKTVEQFIDTRRRRSDICECDRCGYRCARGFIHDERFKYCPNCGARIEVGTHERA